MFGKLVKYEMRSYWKSFLPLWGAVLVLAVINGFTLPLGDRAEVDGFLGFLVFVMPVMLLFGFLVAVAVLTLVLTIRRFFSGLLGDEGYLMFTLPVNTDQLIGAKLLSAMIVTLLSGIVAMASVFIILAMGDGEGFREGLAQFPEFFSMLTRELGGGGKLALYTAELICFGILAHASQMLHIYAAIAVGHLAARHRVAASFGAYLAIDLLFSFLFNTVLRRGDIVLSSMTEFSQVAQTFFLGGMGASLLLCAVFWLVTRYILKNRLALE